MTFVFSPGARRVTTNRGACGSLPCLCAVGAAAKRRLLRRDERVTMGNVTTKNAFFSKLLRPTCTETAIAKGEATDTAKRQNGTTERTAKGPNKAQAKQDGRGLTRKNKRATADNRSMGNVMLPSSSSIAMWFESTHGTYKIEFLAHDFGQCQL